MAKKKRLALEKYIAIQESFDDRWRLFARTDRDFIYVKELGHSSNRYSLAPLLKYSDEDCKKALNIARAKGQDDWIIDNTQTGNWTEVKRFVADYLNRTNKGSSNTNTLSHLNNLILVDPKFSWEEIKKWLHREHKYGDSGFRNKLDSLTQIRKAFFQRDSEDPLWLTANNIRDERGIHNANKPKKKGDQQESAKVRAIVSKEDAEKYFDTYIHKYPLEVWCLAMMLCYGLRNHELWFVQPLKDDFIRIPWGLTKSIKDHVVWPLYKSWIKRYGLIENLSENQKILHKRCTPDIRDVNNQTQKAKLDFEEDRGITMNNKKLGDFITTRTIGTRGKMPELIGDDPRRGKRNGGVKVDARPYDLRHTFAVTMATDPAWSHISEEQTAKAMGHGLEVHRRNYQLWIDAEKETERLIKEFEHPYAA